MLEHHCSIQIEMKWYYWLVVAAVLVTVITVILMIGMTTQGFSLSLFYLLLRPN